MNSIALNISKISNAQFVVILVHLNITIIKQKESINQRVTKLIKELGITATAFASSIGVTPSVISDIVGKRQNKPSFSTIEKMIHTYPNLNLSWLFNGTAPIFHQNPYHIEDLGLDEVAESQVTYVTSEELESMTRQELISQLKERDKLILVLREQLQILKDRLSASSNN